MLKLGLEKAEEPEIKLPTSIGVSNLLEENSSLSHSVVFFYFFALVT